MSERDPTQRTGFTLLEAVLALMILAVMAAIAVPRFGLSVTRYQADLAAQRIAADLQLVQQTAKSTGSSLTIQFYPGRDCYLVDGVTALSGSSDRYLVFLDQEPYYSDLTQVNFAAGTSLVFNGWGLPEAGGAIVLTTGSQSRTVTVDSETGTVTIE